jgi:hypothetical protein
VIFCLGTRWGGNYVTFARKSWATMKILRQVPGESRWMQVYDETYPVLLYIRDNCPPESMILLPPRQYFVDHSGGAIPLLGSPSSAYGFIYPRVPVHAGEEAPYRDRITHLLVWEHWGLDWVDPGARPTESNRIGLYPVGLSAPPPGAVPGRKDGSP